MNKSQSLIKRIKSINESLKINEAALKTGDNVSIKTKNFNAYGKIIDIAKNGAVEVKFFNDKTSKEEIAFFDLKQLTKVHNSSVNEAANLESQIKSICAAINKSKDFDGLQISVARGLSNIAGPNNMSGKATVTFRCTQEWDAAKDYTKDDERFYKRDVAYIEAKKLYHIFDSLGKHKMYATLKKVYAYFEKSLSGYEVTWSYQRAFGSEKTKFITTGSVQALFSVS